MFVCLSNVCEGLAAREVWTSALLWLFNVCAGLNAREVGDRLDAREMLNYAFLRLSDVCEGLGRSINYKISVCVFVQTMGRAGCPGNFALFFLWLFNVCAGLTAVEVCDELEAREMFN